MISSTTSTPRADGNRTRLESLEISHLPPFRNRAPISPPASDPTPPTTAEVKAAKDSVGVKVWSMYWPYTWANRAPATAATKPETAKAVSLALSTPTP